MGVIYLVRHGQASFGKSNYDELSDIGREQSRLLGQTWKARGIRPDILVSGSLVRHRQTLDGIVAGMDVPKGPISPRSEDAAWNELDAYEILRIYQPRWANQAVFKAEMLASLRPRKTFGDAYDAALQRWVDAGDDASYSQSWQAFQNRVLGGLHRVANALKSGESAVVATSGGPIAAVGQSLFGVPPAGVARLNQVIVNAGVTKVILGSSGLHLSTWNDHGHFEHRMNRLVTYR
jgi:broad specificity phosphatase PhoE